MSATFTEKTYFPAGMVPTPNPEDPINKGFWDAAREGKLVVQACQDCNAVQFPAEVICHKCHSYNLGWKELSGKGKVWSYVIVNRPGHPGLADVVPYNAGLIQMDDEPDFIYLTNVVDASEDEIKVGLPVEVIFEQHENITIPRFQKA